MKNTPDKNSGAENPPSLETSARRRKIDQSSMTGLKALHNDFARFAEEKEQEYLPQMLDKYTRVFPTAIEDMQEKLNPLIGFKLNEHDLKATSVRGAEIAQLYQKFKQEIAENNNKLALETGMKIDALLDKMRKLNWKKLYKRAKWALYLQLETMGMERAIVHDDLSVELPSGEDIRQLANLAVEKDNPITKIRLNSGGSDEGEILTDILKSPNNRLRELLIDSEGQPDSGTAEIMTALNSPFNKIEKLKLSGLDLGDKEAKAMAADISQPGNHLKYLDLSRNNIGLAGIKSITRALGSQHNHLEYIDISSNVVDFEFTAAVFGELDELTETWDSLNNRIKIVTDLRLHK